MQKKHVFGSFNLNNSEKHRLSFEDILLGTLDTYTKKMNPPSAVLGGGVHGKVCWLIAYFYSLHEFLRVYLNSVLIMKFSNTVCRRSKLLHKYLESTSGAVGKICERKISNLT